MKLEYNLAKSLLIKAFCVLVGLSFFFSINAQNLNKRKTLRKARKAFYSEKYIDSQNLFQQLVNAEPTNDIYNFEAGLSYYFSTYQQTKSIPFFEAALANSKEDTIVELFYYLGKAYQLNSEYDKANKAFNSFAQFIDYQTKDGKILKNDILKETNYNKNGLEYSTLKNKNIFIDNLGKNVNSIDREYAPVLNINKDVILFTSRRKINGNKNDKSDLLPYEDIYVSKKTENGWELVTDKTELKKYIPENVNTKKHDASITYSADGKIIYTYKKDAIWNSTYENGVWSSLKRLDDKINISNYNVPSVTISSDGNTMFLVSTKFDGIGGKDIYKSVKKSDGSWEAPIILGSNINTPDDEDGPYLTNDGKTLYFSSKGHSSIGGYDFFKSELIDGEWSNSVSLGIPFNSPADDIFLVIDENGKNGFFSSSRVNGNGSYDIYSFSPDCKSLENTEIRGLVYQKNDKTPLKSSIELTNLATNNIENSTNTISTNGKFLIVAKPQNNYKLTIDAEGFTPQNINISIPKQCEYYQLFTEIQLEKLTTNGKNIQVATIYNSFFNRNDLNESILSNLEIEGVKNQIPTYKDESDNNYEADIEFIAKSRKFDPESTANFTIIRDSIEVDLLTANTINTVNKDNNEISVPEFGPVYFDFDKSSLTKDAKNELDKISKYLHSQDGKNLVLKITGYTDGKRDLGIIKKIFALRKIEFTTEAAEQRSKEYNIKLSKNRAEKVSAYIKNNGVKSNQLIIDYVGEDNPAYPNINSDGTNNLENQKRNRRVTLKLSKQATL